MAFLSIPNMDTTFQTCTIRQRCKERPCVKKGGCGKAKFVYFSSAVSHACNLIQDQDGPYNIMNVSSSNTSCWKSCTLEICKILYCWPTVPRKSIHTGWSFNRRICIHSHTIHLEDIKSYEEKVDWVLYIINFKCTLFAWEHVLKQKVQTNCLVWMMQLALLFFHAQRNQAMELQRHNCEMFFSSRL